MTESEFSRQLSELSSVAADLNRESDSINNLLSQYELKLRALNVGLEVSVGIGCGTLTWKRLALYEKSPDDKSQRYLGGHLKTGHTWTGQNRPKE